MTLFKSLRAPEQLFRLAMWAVSLVFAGFLIGLGGKIVGDLPGVKQTVMLDEFVDSVAARRIAHDSDTLRRRLADLTAEHERADLKRSASDNAYRSARETFQNWIATRTATTDPQQDPEVVRRTRALDSLQATARATQADVERLDADQLRAEQAIAVDVKASEALRSAAFSRYKRAQFRQELRVFGIRLALTLPLLLIAAWLAMRKRNSDYWPLARGFVIFAVFAFFVELVPYLPSYGGYVRYSVGVIASVIVGHYVIRTMRRYLARRRELERQGEADRRRALDHEFALRKMEKHLCPGCDRAITGGPAAPSNFCAHCGMKLFDTCAACGTRKNAFYAYCPTCGVGTEAGLATASAG